MKTSQRQEKEFASFLEKYKRLISKVSGIYCHNPEERKDLIQEIIIQLWRAYPKYDKKFSPATWTYRIAFNVSISHLRKRTSRSRIREAYKNEMEWLDFAPLPMMKDWRNFTISSIC
ncbi:RNA polymerase sigma factor [Marinilabilia salmonicolor]|uniref:RNA polymerase sigma factor n=1 Tax=Marinilabilia salmonicolor TaxID=989 RepID=UPI000B09B1B7|nr:RNA polymerase sigma factor [Marinilabilia salmonicolor]